MISTTVFLFSWKNTDASVTSRSDAVGYITSLEGPFGTWTSSIFCNDGSYAIGFQFKTEPYKGVDVDDTCGDAVRLLCSDNDTITTNAAHAWGDWSDWEYCDKSLSNYNFLNGFRTFVQSSQGLLYDDSALQCVHMQCHKNYDVSVYSPSNCWFSAIYTIGEWSHCDDTSVICGIQEQYETPSPSWNDETGLNSVRFYCCTKPNTPEPTLIVSNVEIPV